MITVIVATDRNGLIGSGDKLPWHIPADLKFYKEMTVGKTILMGRRTFEGLPGILPNRKTIVVTSDTSFKRDGIEVTNDIDNIFDMFKNTDEELMVSGGAQIYEQAYKVANRILISRIDNEFSGDKYLPEFNKDEFELVCTTQKEGFVVEEYRRKK